MSRSKSHWRQPPASDDFAEVESTEGYEYGSPGSQSLAPFLHASEHSSKTQMARRVSSSTKSRRSSTADAEFEVDDQWNGDSDEDSKRKGRKKGDAADKLVVSRTLTNNLLMQQLTERGRSVEIKTASLNVPSAKGKRDTPGSWKPRSKTSKISSTQQVMRIALFILR